MRVTGQAETGDASAPLAGQPGWALAWISYEWEEDGERRKVGETLLEYDEDWNLTQVTYGRYMKQPEEGLLFYQTEYNTYNEQGRLLSWECPLVKRKNRLGVRRGGVPGSPDAGRKGLGDDARGCGSGFRRRPNNLALRFAQPPVLQRKRVQRCGRLAAPDTYFYWTATRRYDEADVLRWERRQFFDGRLFSYTREYNDAGRLLCEQSLWNRAELSYDSHGNYTSCVYTRSDGTEEQGG